MTDDMKEAEETNRAFVKAQRQALGLDKPKYRKVHGMAKVVLYLSEMETLPSDEVIAAAEEKAEKQIRHDCTERGEIVDRVMKFKYVNGDREVRVFTTKKVPLDG